MSSSTIVSTASGTAAPAPALWSSRLAFILAAAGSAVGLGNIWKFPYITGENGGGAFVLVYLACIAVIGIPVMIAEVMLGRRGRHSPINSMREIARQEGVSRHWKAIGWLATLAAFLILSFYSVIAGWTIPYIFHALQGDFVGVDGAVAGEMFGQLLSSPLELTVWHSLFMVLAVIVSVGGVRHGLERAVTWLMPALLLLLVMLVGYGMSTEHFGTAVSFLFEPDFSSLSAAAVLVALGHAFFTLSLASGSMMAYGAYLPKGVSIVRTSLLVAVMDTMVALMAGLAIFPIVFANGLEPGAGPGLIFNTLPVAFGQMPGGSFFATLFFVLLLFAAWTSALSMLEAVVKWLEEQGMTRRKAAISGGLAAWTVGLTTVLSLNVWSGFTPLDGFARFEGKTLFDLYDFLTANVMMPLVALLTAVFVGWVMQKSSSKEELGDGSVHRVWLFIVRYLTPVALVVLFISNL